MFQGFKWRIKLNLLLYLQLTPDNYYDENDTIPAFTNISSAVVKMSAPGFLPLPKGDFSGLCNDNNYAKFSSDGSTECFRRLGSNAREFIAHCANGISSSNVMATNLLLSSVP